MERELLVRASVLLEGPRMALTDEQDAVIKLATIVGQYKGEEAYDSDDYDAPLTRAASFVAANNFGPTVEPLVLLAFAMAYAEHTQPGGWRGLDEEMDTEGDAE